MRAIECNGAWDGWNAIKHLRLGQKSGRFAAFYDQGQHIVFNLAAGEIAELLVSDRKLKIEHVMLRMGLITADDIHLAFRQPEMLDRTVPLARVLIRLGRVSYSDLSIARQRQMNEALQHILTANRDTLIYIPGPINVQRIETVIRFEDALDSAFAELRFALEHGDRQAGERSEGRPFTKLNVLSLEDDPATELTRRAR